MRDLLIKKGVYAGSYFVLALLLELITFQVIGLGSFPTYAWLDIAAVFLLAAIVFILPSFIAQTVVVGVLLAVQAVLAVANELLYTMSGYIFGLSMLSLAGEAAGAFDPTFVNFPFLILALLLVAAEVAFLSSLVRWKKASANGASLQTAWTLVSVFILSFGLSIAVYSVQSGSFVEAAADDSLALYKDDSYLYDSQYISAKAYRRFGTFGFYYKNVVNFFSDLSEASGDEDAEESASAVEALRDYFAQGESSADLQDLDLTQYGGAGAVATGLLDGQNVVLVVIESGEWYAINSLYTPTLYALADQGVAMTQYYARDKTNHSEAMSVLGSYPVRTENCITPSMFSKEGLMDHDFAFTLPNLLQEDGYTTNYFHANSGEFYGRSSTFGELYGFDHARFLETSDRLKGFYEKDCFYDFDRDSEFISQYMDEFTRVDGGDTAFYTMLMSITSHGSYDELLKHGDYTADMSEEEKNAFSEKALVQDLEVYYERIDRYPAAEENIEGTVSIAVPERGEDGELTVPYLRYKRYQAAIMDLDVGVNRLIAQLQESGELGNTTFVFYADHNGYYSGQQYALKGVDEGTTWDTMIYNIPFFFWSGKYMDLSVESDLYDGVEYVNDDPNVASVYGGAFYYDLRHTRTDDSFPLGGAKITKFCNSFDIVPTLLDLCGFSYNTRLYQGVSVFDEPVSVFVSRESGQFNDTIYTDGCDLYVRAEADGSGGAVSSDGQILLRADGSARILRGGTAIEYTAEETEGCLRVEGDFIVYDLWEVLSEEEESDRRYLFSDSVYAFLVQAEEYYEKQEYLETMYSVDYFRYEPVGTLVQKIV